MGSLLLATPQSSSSRTLNTKSSIIYDGLTPEEKEELCMLLCYNLLAWNVIAFVNSIIVLALTPKQIWCPKSSRNRVEQHHDGSLPPFVMPINQAFSNYNEQRTLAGHSVGLQHHQYPPYPLQASNSQQHHQYLHQYPLQASNSH